MPQATEEQRKRWGSNLGVGEEKAIAFLEAAGYRLKHDWCWEKPSPDHVPTDDERGAEEFLVDEWDFGWILNGKPSPDHVPTDEHGAAGFLIDEGDFGWILNGKP
jgi:hypothetical protein